MNKIEAGEAYERTGSMTETVKRFKNATGVNLSEFQVLKWGSPIISPSANLVAWKNQQAFEGNTPTEECDFAITQQPMPSGSEGLIPCTVSGVTPCKIEVSDANHTHAVAGTTVTKLVSANSGPAKILWKESGTGEKNALILLANQSGESGGVAFATWDFTDSYFAGVSISNFSSSDTSVFSEASGTVTIGKHCSVILEGRYTYDITVNAWTAPASGIFWYPNNIGARIERDTGLDNIINSWADPRLQGGSTASTSQVFDISMAGFNAAYDYNTAGVHPGIVWRDTGLIGSPINNESFSGTVTLIQAES